MATRTESSDAALIDLLRSSGGLGVSEIAEAMEVTATSVRQRLSRLMSQGSVQRELHRDANGNSRGRPAHRYSLTAKARQQAGNNFADLAIVLWRELRAVKDPEIRRGLLQRVATSMSGMYADAVTGETLEQRMASVADLFAERRVPVTAAAAESNGNAAAELPVLTVRDCPYPELAEQDRGICALERMVFSELVEENLRLSQCRLDGDACCQFQAG